MSRDRNFQISPYPHVQPLDDGRVFVEDLSDSLQMVTITSQFFGAVCQAVTPFQVDAVDAFLALNFNVDFAPLFRVIEVP